MILQFELTISNHNTCDGIIENKGRYFIHLNVAKLKANKLNGRNFRYSFGDGWETTITVSKNKRQKSNGFLGYDWMVDDILKYDKIFPIHNRLARAFFEKEFKAQLSPYIKSAEYLKTDAKFLTENLASIIRELHHENGVGV
jgi:hypothetical protein